jgi:peptidoglycan/LPS O-acetylase OafA/YrhL
LLNFSKEKLSASAIIIGFLFTAVCLLIQKLLEDVLLLPPSRRLANLSYAFSMVIFCLISVWDWCNKFKGKGILGEEKVLRAKLKKF